MQRCQGRRNPILLTGAVLFMLTAACSTMPGIEDMEITLSNLEFKEVTVFETTLVAKLRITNPNPDPFTFDGASFKLYLEDKKVGTGTAPESFTVDRLDSTVVDAVFHINNASALLRLKDIFAGDDEVSYGVRGTLFTDGNFGTRKLKVEKTGRIDLKGMKAPETDEPDLLTTPISG